MHISLDMLKTRNRERLLWEDCLVNGNSFAVDNTNPTKADHARYSQIAKAADYQVIGYFFESKLQPCMQLNALIIIPALLFALSEVNSKTPDERYTSYSTYNWYKSIKKAMKKRFLKDTQHAIAICAKKRFIAIDESRWNFFYSKRCFFRILKKKRTCSYSNYTTRTL